MNADEQEPMTLDEIAEVEGVSHQAIHEALRRAFRKARKVLDDKQIKLEDLV